MSDTSWSGQCLCGATRFSAKGEANWILHCHCESCRRAASSPVVTWVSLPAAAFAWAGAPPQRYVSSPGVTRRFCATCGSPMSYEAERFPGEVHVYAASLDDQSGVAPSRHVFVEEQVDWFEVHDDLPRKSSVSRSQALYYGPRKP